MTVGSLRKMVRRQNLLAAGFAVLVALGASGASAIGALGYYTGAYATPGESGCSGADGSGASATGGCTPGVDALVHAQAFAYGARGPTNHAEAIADLPSATLIARMSFPDGAPNSPIGAANLTDTITILGALPANESITVVMAVDSKIEGGNSLGFVNLAADLSTSSWEGSSSSVHLRGETASGPELAVLTRTLTVNDANRTFRVDATLRAAGGGIPGSQACDALALIWLSLPAGLSISSASGVFATAPEPSVASLLWAGLGGLGVLQRLKRDPRRKTRAPNP